MKIWILLKIFLLFIVISLLNNAYTKNYRGKIIKVGPNYSIKLPSEAAKIANDNDIIEIEPAAYLDDVAIWTQNNLTIKGMGGIAKLIAENKNAEGKAIWVIKGNNTVIENIGFYKANVPDRNGAGIRLEGANLYLKKCYFQDNENGILTGANNNSEIRILQCEFINNGYGDGYSHNIYVGGVKRLEIKFSYIHKAKVGHNIKSRAKENFILYNRIMDEENGNSSYLIDFSNGGKAIVVGNLFHQGESAENNTMISFGAEGLKHAINEIFIINNTFVNDRKNGKLIKVNPSTKTIVLKNNLIVGINSINLSNPNTILSSNMLTAEPFFVNRKEFDYRLTKKSPAIDAGDDSLLINDIDLTPKYHYIHPLSFELRAKSGKIDIGAYEFLQISDINSSMQRKDSKSIFAFPNPFSSSTRIIFQASGKGKVEIFIYDIMGNLITKLFEGKVAYGKSIIKLDRSVFDEYAASGIYYVVLKEADTIYKTKLIYLK